MLKKIIELYYTSRTQKNQIRLCEVVREYNAINPKNLSTKGKIVYKIFKKPYKTLYEVIKESDKKIVFK